MKTRSGVLLVQASGNATIPLGFKGKEVDVKITNHLVLPSCNPEPVTLVTATLKDHDLKITWKADCEIQIEWTASKQ